MGRGHGIVALGVVAAVLAACGDPQYRYARNDTEKVYVRVPYSWSVLDRTDVFDDEDQLTNSAVQPVQVWVLDGSADADPRHVEDSERDEPVGTAQVFAIRSQELAESVSLPTEREFFGGTWYHDPANRDALEAYHAKALMAHESQTVGFDGDIPKPPLPPPSAIEAAATGDPGGITDLPPPSPAPPEPTE